MTSTGYIKSLDGIRAIAILLVMSFHSQLTSFGWIGVQLFFVLSGFLITKILLKDKKKSGEPLSYKFKRFWIRRSLRIFPLYYAYILVIGVSYLIVGFPEYYPVYFPYIISYTANFPLVTFEKLGNPLFNHLWSLSIEEQFYLIFPLIILLSPVRRIREILISIIILSPIARFYVGEYYTAQGLSELTVANGVNFNTLCQLDAFCLGGIISAFALDSKIKKPFTVFLSISCLTFVAGVVTYVYGAAETSFLTDLGYSHYFIGNYQHVWHYSLLNFLFASMILVTVSVHSKKDMTFVWTLLDSKFLVRIGKVSYGMYLIHWLIWVYIFGRIFQPEQYYFKVILFIPYVLTVYILAEISYRLFELRFIELKDRISPTDRIPAKPKESIVKI